MDIAQDDPTEIRYIKLGRGGRWEDVSLDRGEIHFGHRSVPHDLALTWDRGAIKRKVIELGKSSGTATDDTREIIDFYSQGPDCLWVTLARGHLWWAFAEPEVVWLGGDGQEHGARIRRTIGGWKNVDLNGYQLTMARLSSRLTQVGRYQGTICRVKHQDYLLRRIRGVEEPIVTDAKAARDALIDVTSKAIPTLDWTDFETLTDMVFSRSGWYRVSELGGTQKTVDLELDQPTTNERALVQVKSKASQSVLDDYIARLDRAGTFNRMFFVCHSPKGELAAGDRSNVHVWAGRELAATIVKLGLHDWVFDKIG